MVFVKDVLDKDLKQERRITSPDNCEIGLESNSILPLNPRGNGTFFLHKYILASFHARSKATLWMRLILPLALVLVLMGITALALNSYYYNYKRPKNSVQLTRSVTWLDPERYEKPQSRLMEDFKTDCIPGPPQYFLPRVRRDMTHLDALLLSSLNDTVASDIWSESVGGSGGVVPSDVISSGIIPSVIIPSGVITSGAIPSGGFPSRNAGEPNVLIVQHPFTNNTDPHTSHQKYVGDIEQPIRIDTTREENPEQDYDEKPDEKKNVEIRRRAQQVEDYEIGREDPVAEEVEPECEPATQHAFWKGQGDPFTLNVLHPNICCCIIAGRLMKQYMDTTVNPCDDFYQYACGNWAHYNPIPQDKAAFDTFEVLRESLDAIIKELQKKCNSMCMRMPRS